MSGMQTVRIPKRELHALDELMGSSLDLVALDRHFAVTVKSGEKEVTLAPEEHAVSVTNNPVASVYRIQAAQLTGDQDLSDHHRELGTITSILVLTIGMRLSSLRVMPAASESGLELPEHEGYGVEYFHPKDADSGNKGETVVDVGVEFNTDQGHTVYAFTEGNSCNAHLVVDRALDSTLREFVQGCDLATRI